VIIKDTFYLDHYNIRHITGRDDEATTSIPIDKKVSYDINAVLIGEVLIPDSLLKIRETLGPFIYKSKIETKIGDAKLKFFAKNLKN